MTGNKVWTGENAPPGTAIQYHLANPARGEVSITIESAETGEVFRNIEGTGDAGLNRVQWNLRGNPPERPQGGGFGGGGFGGNQAPMADPGVYRVTLQVDGTTLSTTVHVLEDAWMDQR